MYTKLKRYQSLTLTEQEPREFANRISRCSRRNMWQRFLFVFRLQTSPPVLVSPPRSLSGPSLDTANNCKYVLIAISDNPRKGSVKLYSTCSGGNGGNKESRVTASERWSDGVSRESSCSYGDSNVRTKKETPEKS